MMMIDEEKQKMNSREETNVVRIHHPYLIMNQSNLRGNGHDHLLSCHPRKSIHSTLFIVQITNLLLLLCRTMIVIDHLPKTPLLIVCVSIAFAVEDTC